MKINTGNGPQPSVDSAGIQNQKSKDGQTARLKNLCQEFEAVFVHTMLKGMRATIPGDGLLEKGFGSEIMEEMRDVEVSKAVSQHHNIGIAEAFIGSCPNRRKVQRPKTEGKADIKQVKGFLGF